MANVKVILAFKSPGWVTGNTDVLDFDEPVWLTDGRYARGDGVTQVQNLTFFGGTSLSSFTYATKDITGLTDVDLSGLSGTVQIILTSTNATETINSLSNFTNVDRLYLCPEAGLTVTINDASVSGYNIRLFATPLVCGGDSESFICFYKKGSSIFQESFIDQYVTVDLLLTESGNAITTESGLNIQV